jgi:hypothetical protein
MPDELHSLAKITSNDLFESHLESRKLDAMKELAYGASHEINNPLANIAARAQTLLRDENDHQRRQALLAIHKQALRAHEMISDLMLFARPPELAREKLDISKLLGRVTSELSDACRQHDVQIIMDLPKESLEIEADREQLAVAFSALCTNSLEAIGTSGTIRVALRHEPAGSALLANRDLSDAQGYVMIEVTDSGPGLSEQACRHLFDPFYSGREAGRGLGFGLSKCWRIIAEHGGTVTVANFLKGEDSGLLKGESSGRGTCFTLFLPANSGEHPTSSGQPEHVS